MKLIWINTNTINNQIKIIKIMKKQFLLAGIITLSLLSSCGETKTEAAAVSAEDSLKSTIDTTEVVAVADTLKVESDTLVKPKK